MTELNQPQRLRLTDTALLHRINNPYARLAIVAAICWLGVNTFYIFSGIDWLNESDTGWYWRVANDLLGFDTQVQPGFPFIARILSEVFPHISPATLMQAVDFLAYTLMVPLLYLVFKQMHVNAAWYGALLLALYPLTGITNAVQPRVNAVLYLFIVAAVLAYLRGRIIVFLCCLTVLTLLHRSILPFVGIIALVGLWERKIKFWMLIPTFLPLAVYWLAGALHHGSLFWYLTPYSHYEPESILGLPLGDGLLGTVVVGLRGSLPDLIKGFIMIAHFFVALFLLATRFWERRPFLLSLIIPPILLGLILPANEAWSLINYSMYLAIPFVVYLNTHGKFSIYNRGFLYTTLIICYISQFTFAAYEVFIYR